MCVIRFLYVIKKKQGRAEEEEEEEDEEETDLCHFPSTI